MLGPVLPRPAEAGDGTLGFMAIDDALTGLDPYDLMAREAARIEAFATGLDYAAWAEPSACAGWSRRDLMAHLVADEVYFHAGLDGTVADLIGQGAAKGATDLHSFNQLGVDERREIPAAELVRQWVADDARTREGMRALDGGDVDTSVGAYSARWQAFHLAVELATHADDLGVPISDAEAADRLDWLARVSSFTLQEGKPGVAVHLDGDRVTVTPTDGDSLELDAATFVAAVAARLPEGADLDDAARALLSTMP